MQLGKLNKLKGDNAEVLFSEIFSEIGFSDCFPSRNTSKIHDHAKVDLINIPFNIQIKAGKQKNLNPGKELFSMFSCIQTMFPKEDVIFKKPYLLIHHYNEDNNVKDSMVYMSLQQFDLFRRDSPAIKYDCLKEFKFNMNSEFKSIVGMTFKVFEKEIILKKYI